MEGNWVMMCEGGVYLCPWCIRLEQCGGRARTDQECLGRNWRGAVRRLDGMEFVCLFSYLPFFTRY